MKPTTALALALLLLPSTLTSTAIGADDGHASAPLDVAYNFDTEGLLSLRDATSLPVAKGTVVAHWYAHEGWAVVLFEGLDPAASGPLCLGTSAIDPVTGLVGNIAFAPMEPGACDDRGAGPLPMAGRDTGVRACAGSVAFATRIPQESGGALIANVVTFAGDGTGIGVSGRLEGPVALEELDRALVDCGPLPPAREPVPATPRSLNRHPF